ncbi:MAG TPA: SPOR domain-containing protein [Gemmatimonadaceae bacterium]|nr:SPOR domain-containing protein [Gemmatimonadaceae bacterium]
MMIRPQCVRIAAFTLLLASPNAGAQDSTATRVDSVLKRAQQLATTGETGAARALADTLVRMTAEGSDARAEALFLRASLAGDVAAAETDYRMIMVEYRLSPRAADATLRLGQAEYARGDRAAARRHLERLLLEHPGTPAAADAWYWLGRARADDGDVAGGCAALDTARVLLPPDDVERRNRVTFAAQRCRNLGPPPATTPTTQQAPVQPPSTQPQRGTTAASAPRWSAQVAAYRTRREAENRVNALKTRGYEARVDSLALFHVRVGAFEKKADADALVARLKSQRIDAFVVEAIRRAP